MFLWVRSELGALPWLIIIPSNEAETPLLALACCLQNQAGDTCFSKVPLDWGENMWFKSAAYK